MLKQFQVSTNAVLSIIGIVLSVVLYTSFAYYLERSQFPKLVLLYFGLFAFALYLFKSNHLNFKLLLVAGLIFRLVFLFSVPNLSQDFYRFIWDGKMILNGLNPYLYTPNYLMGGGHILFDPNEELFKSMGSLSASHYSNYPPLNQFFFALSSLFGTSVLSNIISMRLLIIAADIGVVYFGVKLLNLLKLPKGQIFYYFLNPFIIIELTGNLHFEGLMAFFLIVSIWFLYKSKWIWSAVFLACSISIKLIPLIFIPLLIPFLGGHFKNTRQETNKIIVFLSRLTRKNTLRYLAIVVVLNLLFFLPFFSVNLIDHYAKTIGLWFGSFEFNASIYYILREFGFLLSGYNQIAIIGKILPVLIVVLILCISIFKPLNTVKQIIGSMIISLSCYLFLSTTVHPWYLCTLVALTVFSEYKFPLVWSFMVVLSYWAYSNVNYTENFWLIAIEYLSVGVVFIFELSQKTSDHYSSISSSSISSSNDSGA